MPASAPDTLWLATRDAQGSGWLALDLQAPARIVSFADARRPPPTIGGGLLVGTVEAGLAETTASGGLAVSSALLRSLLAPRRVTHWGDLLAPAGEGPGSSELGASGATDGDPQDLGADEPSDPEERLRREASLAWGLLATWAAYPEVLRGRIATILDRTMPAQGRVVALLDRLAERRDRSPFAGWSRDEGAAVSLVKEPGVAPEGRVPGEPPPADAEGLQRWMQTAEGLGALFSSSFAPRQEQALMAGEVTRALAERRALLVEAGTGVGKTLAYLVPLLVLLGAGDRRAVVATHTRALQRQILLHDWPRLAGLVPHLKVRPLMGRGNYLCRRSRDTFLAAAVASPEEAARQVALLAWLARTATGEREELEHHPLLAASLRNLFETAAPCSPRICYEREGGDICYVQRARRRAREADLLVVNHALLLQDLRAERAVIGPYDHLVIDEAHRLPAAALATWSVRCDRGRTEALVELAGGSRRKGEAPERVRLVALRLQERAGGKAAAAACADLGLRLAGVHAAHANWWRSLDGLAAGLHGTDRVPGGTLRIRDKDVAFAPLRSETATLLESLAAARSALARLGEASAALGEIDGVLEDELALLAQCGPLLEGLGEDLRRITADPDDRWVTWSDPTARGGVRSVGATPLFAGELLREAWLGAGLAPVATSATLAVSGDFAHLLAELGLDKRRPPTNTRQVFSPFDFATQARFVAPDPERFPGPDEAGYVVAVAWVLLALVRATPRRTMALFTSYRLLDAVARRLREEGGGLFAPEAREGVVLLTQQGSGGTAELARRFRYHPRALLLGTSTFWEGVDFPGEELEILVVTKLPFRVPTDPWVEARCDWLQAQGENPFASFMVRDAVLRLRQGIGRLLRRQDDRGLVVLLDTRLHRREYGVTFLDALPGPCAYFRDAADLAGQARSFFVTD